MGEDLNKRKGPWLLVETAFFKSLSADLGSYLAAALQRIDALLGRNDRIAVEASG
jgi:hypothetical protein